MTETDLEKRQRDEAERTRRADHEAAQRAFNELLHARPNAVRTTRLTTVSELNTAIRRAAGHDEPAAS